VHRQLRADGGPPALRRLPAARRRGEPAPDHVHLGAARESAVQAASELASSASAVSSATTLASRTATQRSPSPCGKTRMERSETAPCWRPSSAGDPRPKAGEKRKTGYLREVPS